MQGTTGSEREGEKRTLEGTENSILHIGNKLLTFNSYFKRPGRCMNLITPKIIKEF